jgi:hypothetical protein
MEIAFSGGEPCDVVQPADESDDDSSNPNDKKSYYEVCPSRQIPSPKVPGHKTSQLLTMTAMSHRHISIHFVIVQNSHCKAHFVLYKSLYGISKSDKKPPLGILCNKSQFSTVHLRIIPAVRFSF